MITLWVAEFYCGRRLREQPANLKLMFVVQPYDLTVSFLQSDRRDFFTLKFAFKIDTVFKKRCTRAHGSHGASMDHQ